MATQSDAYTSQGLIFSTRHVSEAAIFISGKEIEGLFVLITNDFQYVYGRTAVLYFNKCC